VRYINTLPEEQETVINIIYEDEIVKVYTSKPETIKDLTKKLGEPTTKYKKNKNYYSGASWEISFHDNAKLRKIIVKDSFIQKSFRPADKKREIKNDKNASYQLTLKL
jgi:hypothetical protein